MFSIESRYLKRIDLPLCGVMLLLIGVGLLMIASAVHGSMSEGHMQYFVRRQLGGFGIGVLFFLAALSVDYRALKRWGPFFYLFNLLLLGVVIFAGEQTHGAQRWINLGFFSFQPSEMAKILFIFGFADFGDRYQDLIRRPQGLLLALIYMALPVVLILIQPDLGTSLIFVVIGFIILYAAGARLLHLVVVIAIGLLVLVGAFYLHYQHEVPLPLKDYQINRLMVFIDPDFDPTGAGYNIRQSKIAVGSGGLMGRGLFQGTQSRLDFLPAQHTDFIFSVFGEEMGFGGTVLLLLCFYFILRRALYISHKARDSFGSLLAAGFFALFFAHLVINVGMTIGMMPITGLPLPFLSYGGTFLVVNILAVGLLVNINMRRHKLLFK